MKNSPPELERIFLGSQEIYCLQEGELVEENPPADGEDEVSQLRHDAGQVGDHQDLGRDDAGNAHGRDPHDDAHHPE